MDIVYDSLAHAETGLRKWLEGLSELTALQQGNQPAVETQHVLFSLINLSTAENICKGYTYDDVTDVYQECTVSEQTATYQVDVQYCNTGPDSMIKIIRGFKGGLHLPIESGLNFKYLGNSTVRSVPFVRKSAQRYKYTVDIDFLFRCKVCVDIGAIETAVIRACAGFPNTFIPELTINRP